MGNRMDRSFCNDEYFIPFSGQSIARQSSQSLSQGNEGQALPHEKE